MLQSDHKSSSAMLVLILAIIFIVVVIDYLVYNQILFPKTTDDKYLLLFCVKFYPIMQKDYVLRILYVVALFCFINVSPSMRHGKGMTKHEKVNYLILSIIFTSIFLIGFIKVPIYDLFIYPLIILIQTYTTSKASSLLKENFQNTEIFGISQHSDSKTPFRFALGPREKMKYLVVPHANHGIICEGGTGAGKSASIIKPFIAQASYEGYAGIVYDFNGNPTLESNPILTRCAFWGVNKRILENKKSEHDTRLAFLNFNDLTRTVRVNPFPKYVNIKMDMINISNCILKNLEKEWKEKMDFWAQNARQILTAALHTLQKHYKDYYDLPHAVAIVLSRHDKFLKFIAKDEEICRDFMPVYTAFLNKAEGQIAGSVSSAQSPLSKLDTPEIFWVLSNDQLDLDITRKDNPTLLCIGNDPMRSEALSAVIAAITYICMMNMNQPNRAKSIFCFDEIPSIVLYKLDDFIATCRKYNVCCMFGLQTHEQFKRDYGDKSADVIRNTLGNFFFGNTGDIKTAEYFSSVIGTTKQHDISYTEGDSNTITDRMHLEKSIQPRDIMGQDIGHFMGKVIGGKPAFFNLQFDYFRTEEEDPNYFKDTNFPPFANRYVSEGSDHAQLQFEIDVQNNYKKIYSEIKVILDKEDNEENLKKLLQEINKSCENFEPDKKNKIVDNLKEAMNI